MSGEVIALHPAPELRIEMPCAYPKETIGGSHAFPVVAECGPAIAFLIGDIAVGVILAAEDGFSVAADEAHDRAVMIRLWEIKNYTYLKIALFQSWMGILSLAQFVELVKIFIRT